MMAFTNTRQCNNYKQDHKSDK